MIRVRWKNIIYEEEDRNVYSDSPLDSNPSMTEYKNKKLRVEYAGECTTDCCCIFNDQINGESGIPMYNV